MDSNYAPVRVKSGGTQISRRTVTRGVAWSAPIAAIGVAAPAFAASQPIVVRLCGTTCKHPGSSGDDDSAEKIYHFTFCFTANQAVVANTVNIVSMRIGSVTKTSASLTPTSVPVVTGQTKCYYIDALDFPDSRNTDGTLTFTYTPVSTGIAVTAHIDIVLNGIDRCGTSDHGANPKDYGHPSDSTAIPPPGNTGCV